MDMLVMFILGVAFGVLAHKICADEDDINKGCFT